MLVFQEGVGTSLLGFEAEGHITAWPSGRVINAAAAVMVFVFFTFALAGVLPPKEMGAILGLAIVLDATLIRLLLLPAILRLLGERASWVPRFVDPWLPQVRLSHGD